MSDQEEPVPKLAKIEDSIEEIDDGQEEWLSEGILTDDDYHPTADNDSSAIQSQDETMDIPEDSSDVFSKLKNELEKKQKNTVLNTDKIEEALDNMEKTDENEDDLPGDLSTFLVRKTDGQIIETRDDSDMESVRHTDEDANDTDELLRMLGDDDQKIKKKKEVRKVAEKKTIDHSSDEEDAFERLKRSKKPVRKVPVAAPSTVADETSIQTKTPKKTILKKVAPKAEAEDFSEDDSSIKTRRAKQTIASKIPTRAKPEPTSEDDRVSSDDRTTVKNMFHVKRKVHFAAKSTAKSSVGTKLKKTLDTEMKSKAKTALRPRAMPLQAPEDGEHEEFLDEDAFEEDFREELGSSEEERKQPIMRPERMEEEFPSDGESGSDENSFYDELPSTDSEEDMEEWFTLDIRAERAGDYLPLLGDKAHEVLLDEKQRISGRVASLRENLAAIAEGSRAQAEQLRRASLLIAELDAAIRAA